MPLFVRIFAAGVLLLPILNLIGLSFKHGIPLYHLFALLSKLEAGEYLFLVSSLLSGIGLLFISRWGWWLFIVSGFVFVTHNLVQITIHPFWFNFRGPLLQTFFVGCALFYFLRRDIFAPYHEMYKRGWRFRRRFDLTLPVLVNGKKLLTGNISAGGLFIPMETVQESYRAGDSVRINITLIDSVYEMEGGIAVVYEDGLGIAFRGITDTKRNEIEKKLTALSKAKSL